MNDRSLVIEVKYKLERSLCDSFGFYGYVFCHLIKPTQPPSPATLTASANAGAAADSTKGFITAFRDHLKTCSRLPAGVNVTDNARVVLRVFLKPDCTLAARPQPIRIEGVVRQGGGYLYESIVAALRECQPYNMLPPNKYDEWKVFDISVAPQNFFQARQRESSMHGADYSAWMRLGSNGVTGYELCAHSASPRQRRDGIELVRDRPGYLPAIPHVSDGCLGPARAEAAAIPSPPVKTGVAIPIPVGPRPQRVELLRRNVSGQETIAVPMARPPLALRIRGACKRRHRQRRRNREDECRSPERRIRGYHGVVVTHRLLLCAQSVLRS
jgi:hypothetical protein